MIGDERRPRWRSTDATDDDDDDGMRGATTTHTLQTARRQRSPPAGKRSATNATRHEAALAHSTPPLLSPLYRALLYMFPASSPL